MAFKKDTKVKNNFTKITIGLASPEEILENSYGEVIQRAVMYQDKVLSHLDAGTHTVHPHSYFHG